MINIYCDESCHIQSDRFDVMVLGSISCPKEKVASVNRDILDIKEEYGIKPYAEIKWTKVSNSAVEFYEKLIDYFFNNDDLKFRGYIARGKSEIKKDRFDDLYYKLYYRMLEYTLDMNQFETYSLYLDKKDTIGYKKIRKLSEYLNNHYNKEIVAVAQAVDSSQVILVQLADLLIGALSYKHRKLSTNEAKLDLIRRIEAHSQSDLLLTTPIKQTKTNWFVWVPAEWR